MIYYLFVHYRQRLSAKAVDRYITGAWSSVLISPIWPQKQKLTVSLRSDIVSFWFWGYMGDLRIELQAPVDIYTWITSFDTLFETHFETFWNISLSIETLFDEYFFYFRVQVYPMGSLTLLLQCVSLYFSFIYFLIITLFLYLCIYLFIYVFIYLFCSFFSVCICTCIYFSIYFVFLVFSSSRLCYYHFALFIACLVFIYICIHKLFYTSKM